MRCCGELRHGVTVAFTLIGLLAAGAAAQSPEREVMKAIAARWGIDPARVRVAPLHGAAWPSTATAVRVLGSGADGSWVVAFEDSSAAGSLIVRAGVERDVQVAARDLPRAALLEPADIATRRDVVWGPPGRNDEELVAPGWMTRRRVRAGESLGPDVAEKAPAVVPGQDVRVVWMRGDVSIALAGRAAGRAAVGERVAVRAETGRRLEGIVIADGIVHVGPDAGRTP